MGLWRRVLFFPFVFVFVIAAPTIKNNNYRRRKYNSRWEQARKEKTYCYGSRGRRISFCFFARRVKSANSTRG